MAHKRPPCVECGTPTYDTSTLNPTCAKHSDAEKSSNAREKSNLIRALNRWRVSERRHGEERATTGFQVRKMQF